MRDNTKVGLAAVIVTVFTLSFWLGAIALVLLIAKAIFT